MPSPGARERVAAGPHSAAMIPVADTDIAIIGMAGRFPGARTIGEFWNNLRNGVESITRLSDEELRRAGVPESLLANPDYVKAGAALEDMEWFDAGFFGFNPREAAILDPQHRHFLECAWEALEDAGHVPSRFPGPIGVFAGSGHNAYLSYNLLTNPDLVRAVGLFLLRHTGNDKDFLTTRLSYLLDLRGPSVNIQTACSTSLVAVHAACQSLITGECDLALAGGVTIELPHRQGYLYQDGEILSPDGHCRPFDAASAGTVFGSGVGVAVLRRLGEAIEGGDTIRAVIKGTAINNDGSRKVGYLAPSVEGQARVVTEALAVGGVTPDTISYVEAHGTGTAVGDPIEVAALTQAFRQGTDQVGSCPIGSVKGNIGHLDTAAGIASLIKVVEALRHEELPPSLHYLAPNPACEFATSPFRVQSDLARWPRTAQPRRAGISSLGVGGTNAHVIIEEAPVLPVPESGSEWHLLPVSAKSPVALEQAAGRLADHIEQNPSLSLADAAWTLQDGRLAMPYRRSVVARDPAAAAAAMRTPSVSRSSVGDARHTAAFMFAGGGAQYPEMGRELYRSEPVYREAFEEGLGLLPPPVAETLRPLLLFAVDGAGVELENPSLTLPALFLTQYATALLWRSWGVEPSALIGHSMGEYTAACLAGVFQLKDALALVLLRGRLFESLPPGAMLSVALSEAELSPLLGSELSVAAVNAPNLAVASGPVGAIEALQRTLEEREIDCSRVRIKVAAHSAMLEPILEEFGRFLRELRLAPPRIPFTSNVTGGWISERDATDPDYWVRHLRSPVRFADCLAAILEDPHRLLLEVGPGRTLATLARQHPARRPEQAVATSLRHPDEQGSDLECMLAGLGRLWQHGLEVEWRRLHGGGRRRIPLPAYPFQRERFWIEPGQPAPSASPREVPESLLRVPDIGDWFYEPQWESTPGLPPAEPPACCLVFADRGGLGDRLADRIRGLGGRAVTVRPGSTLHQSDPEAWTIDPAAPDHYEEVLRSLVDRHGPPGGVVHCWTCDDSGDLDTAFFSVLHLAQAMNAMDLEGPARLIAVSTGLQDIAGEATPDPRKALLLGPLRVVPREFPNLRSRSIDLKPGRPFDDPALLDALLAELATDDPAETVALRGSTRWAERLFRVPRGAGNPRLKAQGRYLITGGLGGIGLRLGQHLADRYRARLVLVGRGTMPERSEWEAWLRARPTDDPDSRRIRAVRRMEEAGAEVVVATADVTSTAALKAALAAADTRFGGLDGVIHAAGTLEDGAIALKDRATALRVLAPKVEGTLALAEVLGSRPLDFLVLFSSVSAVAGLAGQADYAAANAFLDAFAGHLSRQGRPAAAVAWTAWRQVGMAAELARQLGLSEDGETEPGEIEPQAPVNPPYPFLEHFSPVHGDPAFVARLSPARHWILGEHRIRGGDAVIPGTGHLELARAAFQRIRDPRQVGNGDPAPVELREVGFVSTFAVAEGGERDLMVRLAGTARSATEVEFRILGRTAPGSPWEEHARGTIRNTNGEPDHQLLDAAAIRARCRRVVDTRGHGLSSHLDFGPRWHNVESIAFGEGEALVSLSLDERFRDELGRFPLHPAMLDMATASAQGIVPGLDPAEDFLVPLSFGRVRMRHPLPPRAVSHVRLAAPSTGDTAVFDVTIADESGRVLVEVEEFTMIRVKDRSLLGVRSGAAAPSEVHRTALANPILQIGLRDGIRPSEGMAALERILSGPLPSRVLVSPLPIDPLVRALRKPPPAPGPTDHSALRGAPAPGLVAAEEVLREHPAIADSAVAERPDQAGQRRIVIWFACRPGEMATGSDLRHWIRERLPENRETFTFVEVDRIPRREGAPDWASLPSPFGTEQVPSEPATATEIAIAESWKELLGVASIGLHDNFFDLGGHSLLAVRFIARLHRRLGVRLLHEQVVIHTLAQLAAKCDEAAQ